MAAPKFNFDEVIVACMNNAGMTDKNERAQFLAQLAHESGSGKWLYEIWGPTAQQRKYERVPDAPWGPGLQPGDPNYVAYNLGNSQPGDGFKYRGRSFIQITGRTNYAACGLYIDKDLLREPDQLAEPETAARGALWYWRVARPKIPALAQAGDTRGVTRLINGGYTGLEDRVRLFNHYLKLAL